jgi:hypothetical protein
MGKLIENVKHNLQLITLSPLSQIALSCTEQLITLLSSLPRNYITLSCTE